MTTCSPAANISNNARSTRTYQGPPRASPGCNALQSVPWDMPHPRLSPNTGRARHGWEVCVHTVKGPMSSAVNEPVPRAPASRFPARPVRRVLARAEVRLLPEGVPGERWPHKSTQQVFCERRPWPGACGLWRLPRCPLSGKGNMASKRGNEDAGPAGGSRRPPRRLLPAKASSRRDGISLGEGWGKSPLSSTDTKMSAYDVICRRSPCPFN